MKHEITCLETSTIQMLCKLFFGHAPGGGTPDTTILYRGHDTPVKAPSRVIAREGTLGISGWGCAAGTLEPLVYTRASSAEFC